MKFSSTALFVVVAMASSANLVDAEYLRDRSSSIDLHDESIEEPANGARNLAGHSGNETKADNGTAAMIMSDMMADGEEMMGDVETEMDEDMDSATAMMDGMMNATTMANATAAMAATTGGEEEGEAEETMEEEKEEMMEEEEEVEEMMEEEITTQTEKAGVTSEAVESDKPVEKPAASAAVESDSTTTNGNNNDSDSNKWELPPKPEVEPATPAAEAMSTLASSAATTGLATAAVLAAALVASL